MCEAKMIISRAHELTQKLLYRMYEDMMTISCAHELMQKLYYVNYWHKNDTYKQLFSK